MMLDALEAAILPLLCTYALYLPSSPRTYGQRLHVYIALTLTHTHTWAYTRELCVRSDIHPGRARET